MRGEDYFVGSMAAKLVLDAGDGIDRIAYVTVSDDSLAIDLLQQILELAVEYDLLPRNPAVGKRRRLKVTMEQLGHTDPAFTLRVYTHIMRRSEDERRQLRALVEGEQWPQRTDSWPADSPGVKRGSRRDSWP